MPRRSGLFERFDALPDPGDARDDATQRLLRFGLRRLIGSGGQSSVVRERATAAGLAVGLWLLFVLI